MLLQTPFGKLGHNARHGIAWTRGYTSAMRMENAMRHRLERCQCGKHPEETHPLATHQLQQPWTSGPSFSLHDDVDFDTCYFVFKWTRQILFDHPATRIQIGSSFSHSMASDSVSWFRVRVSLMTASNRQGVFVDLLSFSTKQTRDPFEPYDSSTRLC